MPIQYPVCHIPASVMNKAHRYLVRKVVKIVGILYSDAKLNTSQDEDNAVFVQIEIVPATDGLPGLALSSDRFEVRKDEKPEVG